MAVVRLLYLLALAVWIGAVVFFSFVVAPAVFVVLDPARAGDVVGAILPGYYRIGIVGSVVALACAILLRRRSAAPGWWSGAVIALALGCATTTWAGVVVHPRAQGLRAAQRTESMAGEAHAAFRRAHRAAVVLNGVSLLAGLVGVGCSAAALRP